MGFGGLLKKVAPYIGAAVGGLVGGPGGAQAGYAGGEAVSKVGGGAKQRPTPVATQPMIRQLPPMSAGSLAEARSQDKHRLKRQYGLP